MDDDYSQFLVLFCGRGNVEDALNSAGQLTWRSTKLQKMQYPCIEERLCKFLDFPKIICNYKLSLFLFSTFVSRNKFEVLGCCVSDFAFLFVGCCKKRKCTWVECTFQIFSSKLILMTLLVEMVTVVIIACGCTILVMSGIFHCEVFFPCSTSLLGLLSNRKSTERGYVKMEKWSQPWPVHCWESVLQMLNRSRTCLIGCEINSSCKEPGTVVCSHQ